MRRKKTHEEFISEVKDIFGNEYSVLNTYTFAKCKLLVRHNSCGNIYQIRADNFLSGRKCRKCYIKSISKTHEQFIKEVNELGNGEYIVLGKYTKDNVKILMKHLICNEIYESTPDRFIQGRRCPKCRKSKGETKISTLLNEKEIKFEEQYRFNECRNKYPLPFDFAIFDKDDNISMLIEYQGIQHYEPIEYLGGLDRFEYTKNNDLIKYNFCKDNNIKLLIISYKEFDNIEYIIDKDLKEVRKE